MMQLSLQRTMQRTATQWNTVEHSGTQWNTVQHKLQHTSCSLCCTVFRCTYYNAICEPDHNSTVQHSATQCNTICNTHCNMLLQHTLQHVATHTATCQHLKTRAREINIKHQNRSTCSSVCCSNMLQCVLQQHVAVCVADCV